jgi:hypothetical protein
VRFVLYLVILRRMPRSAAQHSQVGGATVPAAISTPAETLQSMSHNLTAVDRAEVCSGETCAICLGELAHDVERSGVREDGVVAADKTGAAANAGPVIVSPRQGRADSTNGAGGARSAQSARADEAVVNGPAVQSLMCGHHFHGECIRGWIVHRGAGVSCPLCKQELVTQSSPAVQVDPADRV